MIRRLAPPDAAEFRALRLEALAAHPAAYGSTVADWERAPLADFAAWLERSLVFGAFDADSLIGVAALDRERGGNARHRALVTAVYVRAAARRRGIASGLLAMLAETARGDGVLQLELHVAVDNPAAIAAYEATGFRRFGIVPRAIRSEGRFVDEHLMVWFLDG